MMLARSRSPAVLTTSAALGPSPPMRISSGPSRRNENPRRPCRAASTKRRDRARRRRPPSIAGIARDRVEIWRSDLRSVSGGLRPARPGRRRGDGASDRDRCRSPCNRPRRGSRACSRPRRTCRRCRRRHRETVEEFDRRAAEHGNVEGRSASDSRAAAARHHSRAPGALRAATWEPSSPLSARTFWVASASSFWKRPGSQI